MKKQYKVSIPKPCHEDWSKMTPKEKGRFCGSCSKTVIDFTKKSKEEIQQYLSENFEKRVCGHFNKRQLDTITIEIPSTTFEQQLSFQKLFILALLFVMGTTLFSCQYSDGKKQKIEDVILIDSLETVTDSILECKTSEADKPAILGGIPKAYTHTSATTGVVFDANDIVHQLPSQFKLDSIKEIEEVEEIIEDVPLTGETLEEPTEVEGEVEFTVGFIVSESPRFQGTENLSENEAKTIFNQKMKDLFIKEFRTPQASMDLKSGTYRIVSQFKIDKNGKVSEVKVKASHPIFEKEVKRVIKKLPLLIPGKQRDKAISTKYTFPFRIEVE